mmetsp:Transcript_11074/g.17478  ORF Transcript_11074/g.17478 Transcript_11074/m.17478 type:complete len:223 (-) Transcript_11074:3938-4606(-)
MTMESTVPPLDCWLGSAPPSPPEPEAFEPPVPEVSSVESLAMSRTTVRLDADMRRHNARSTAAPLPLLVVLGGRLLPPPEGIMMTGGMVPTPAAPCSSSSSCESLSCESLSRSFSTSSSSSSPSSSSSSSSPPVTASLALSLARSVAMPPTVAAAISICSRSTPHMSNIFMMTKMEIPMILMKGSTMAFTVQMPVPTVVKMIVMGSPTNDGSDGLPELLGVM